MNASSATPKGAPPEGVLPLGDEVLRQMADSLPDWIAIKDVDGRYLFANSAFCRFFGLPADQVIGRTEKELTPDPERYRRFHEDDLEVIRTRKPKRIGEEMATAPDGKELWVDTTKTPILEPDGSCSRVLVTCTPIDEQRTAAIRLEESKEFLREVIDSIPNPILVKDREGKYQLANKALADIYDQPVNDLVGKTDEHFFASDEEIAEFKKLDAMTLASGEARLIPEERLTTPEGEIRWIQTIKKPLFDHNGIADRLLVVCTDITRRKKIEADLEAAKDEADKANIAKTEFLTRMSHELRTPLNAILGFSQLLTGDENLTDEQVDTLNIINTSGKHLLNLISEILEMSRVEMGELELDCQKLDLPQLLGDVVQLLEARATANGSTLSLSIDSDLPQAILGDGVKLRQIIINLLSNAVKFTQDGSIRVRANRSADDRLKISVQDTGPGISQAETEKLFGTFSQTRLGLQTGEGTGLGLSISKKLVQLMGGEIGVESEPGVGSTFHFEIPLLKAPASVAPTQPTSAPETEDGETAPDMAVGQGQVVLLVDDAAANRLFVSRLLGRLGYTVIEADEGEAALTAFHNQPPDLVLMDINMPGMNGLEATRRIRQWEAETATPRTPVVALTANAFEENRREALDLGFDDFVIKPFEFEELIRAISTQLSQNQAG